MLTPEEAKTKRAVEKFLAAEAQLKQLNPPGFDLYFYGQGASCIHCVQSITLRSAMIAGTVAKGRTEYIGGPDHYAQRLTRDEVIEYTEGMAAEGLGPCDCPELQPVAATEGEES